jgi:hypothetical protein
MYQSMKPLFKKLSASILTACLLLYTTLATAADTSPAASSDYVLDVNTVLAAVVVTLNTNGYTADVDVSTNRL